MSNPRNHLNWACRIRTKEESQHALAEIREPLIVCIPKHCFQARTSTDQAANNWDAQTADELPKSESQSNSSPEVLIAFPCPMDPPSRHQRQAAYLDYGGSRHEAAGLTGTPGSWGNLPPDQHGAQGSALGDSTAIPGAYQGGYQALRSAWGKDFFLTAVALPLWAASIPQCFSDQCCYMIIITTK